VPAGRLAVAPSTTAATSAAQMEPEAAADHPTDDAAELGLRRLGPNKAAERQQRGGAT
jgi:hypothetical protein